MKDLKNFIGDNKNKTEKAMKELRDGLEKKQREINDELNKKMKEVNKDFKGAINFTLGPKSGRLSLKDLKDQKLFKGGKVLNASQCVPRFQQISVTALGDLA